MPFLPPNQQRQSTEGNQSYAQNFRRQNANQQEIHAAGQVCTASLSVQPKHLND